MTERDEEGYTIPDQYAAIERQALSFADEESNPGAAIAWPLVLVLASIAGGLIWLVFW